MDANTLKQKVKPFEKFSTPTSDQWGKMIDAEKLANARNSHNRYKNEYIFFLSDFTFWGSANNSVIATEKGISAKFADELQPLFLEWKDIDYAVALPEIGIRLGSIGKEYNFRIFQNGVQDAFVTLFEELINEEKSTYSLEYESLNDIIANAKTQQPQPDAIKSAISLCDRLLSSSLTTLEAQYNNQEECSIYIHHYFGIIYQRASLLVLQGNRLQAKTDLSEFIKGCNDSVSASYSAFYLACKLLAGICEEDKQYDESLVFLNLATQVHDPDDQREAKELFNVVLAKKTTYMPDIPCEDRRMILCVDDLPSWPVKEFIFADTNMLRKFSWIFETGHPQAGEMYICHPLRPEHYYEVQSFHDRLFDEKRSELVYLLESIGARSVHVEAITGSSIEQQNNINISGNISDGLVTGASSEGSHTLQGNSKRDTRQVAIEDRELHPAEQPHIPNDLIWYPHEPSWQRIAQAALANRYKTLSVELHYHEDYSVNQKRMNQVKSALKLFTKQIEIGWNAETEENLRQRKETIWKYTATFGDDPILNQPSDAMPLSKSEDEYLDDLQAALSAGQISEGTRKILDRQRIRLGISFERASQLEHRIACVSLSDNEKEYLQDIEDLYANGDLSLSAQNLLARRRSKLGISDEQAFKLEHMIKTKTKKGSHE